MFAPTEGATKLVEIYRVKPAKKCGGASSLGTLRKDLFGSNRKIEGGAREAMLKKCARLATNPGQRPHYKPAQGRARNERRPGSRYK
jgi:hypothetical protein